MNIDVLIADDEEKFCKIIKILIERNLKLNVKYATKVTEAIEMITKDNPKIGIIDLCFNNDPIHDNGIEIIENFKDKGNTKFILSTSQSERDKDIQRARSLGVNMIVYKSYNYSKDIIAAVDSFFFKK